MVPNGTTLVIDLTGTWAGLSNSVSVDQARADLIDSLTNYFGVGNITLTVPSFTADVIAGNFISAPYTAQVTISTRADYNAADDAGSIVANLFYNEFGSLPTFSAEGYDTPQASATITTGPTVASVVSSLPSLSTITSSLGSVGMVLVLAIVGIVAILAFSPTGPAAARAVRP